MRISALGTVTVIVCLWGSLSARADLIQLVSANRSVDVFTLAGHSNGSTTASQSQTMTQFGSFDGTANASADWADPDFSSFRSHAAASANQHSTMGALGFAVTQGLSYTTAGPLPGGGIVHMISESFFQVTFTVIETVRFEATLSIFRTLPGTSNYTEMFNLHSASGDMSLASPLGVSGLLNAGETYTLTASHRFEDTTADPLGQNGLVNSTLNVSFAPVPEPSVLVCSFLGLAFLVGNKALTARRRSRALSFAPKP